MFIAAAVIALGILGIDTLMGLTLVDKPRKPVDGGYAVTTIIVLLVLAGAVYELWYSTRPAYGLVMVSVLWGVCLFVTVITIGQIGKPRLPLTATSAVMSFLLGLAFTGIAAYLVFA